MSSIGERTAASSSEAECGRVRDGERPSPRFEVVVASTDTGTRPVPARGSVMAAAEALLQYASVGWTDNDRESAQWGLAGQTEAIELGDRRRLQYHLPNSTRSDLSLLISSCVDTELNTFVSSANL